MTKSSLSNKLITLCLVTILGLSCNRVQPNKNISSTEDLGKKLINSYDFFSSKSLIPASLSTFNYSDSILSPNDLIYRIWVLDPYGAIKDSNLITLRLFEFGKRNERDFADLYILRFYISELPNYSIECLKVLYKPYKGWSTFSERIRRFNLIFMESAKPSILEYDGIGTIVYFQQLKQNNIREYDFSRGYQFYKPNTILEERFKRLLLFIEDEFGIQLSKFESGSDFFNRIYYEAKTAE